MKIKDLDTEKTGKSSKYIFFFEEKTKPALSVLEGSRKPYPQP